MIASEDTQAMNGMDALHCDRYEDAIKI